MKNHTLYYYIKYRRMKHKYKQLKLLSMYGGSLDFETMENLIKSRHIKELNPFEVVNLCKNYVSQPTGFVSKNIDSKKVRQFVNITSGKLLHVVKLFVNYLEQLEENDSLFRIANLENHDTEFYVEGGERKLFLDLIINFIGYIKYHIHLDDGIIINWYPSFKLHIFYEEFLIKLFSVNNLNKLMYNKNESGINDDRLNYGSGENWRMNNLIISGFYKLYNYLLDSRIQPEHFYYFVNLLNNGIYDSISNTYLYIPNYYQDDVIDIIKKIFNNKKEILDNFCNGNIDFNQYIINTYEYSIFNGDVKRDTLIYVDKEDRDIDYIRYNIEDLMNIIC